MGAAAAISRGREKPKGETDGLICSLANAEMRRVELTICVCQIGAAIPRKRARALAAAADYLPLADRRSIGEFHLPGY